MELNGSKTGNFFTSLKVGFFLAIRQTKRTSMWTNVLVVFIMTLTFLNLVVVSGILVGLLEGAVQAVGEYYLGDVFISNLKRKPFIEQSQMIIKTTENLDGVEAVSARYIQGGTIIADFKNPKTGTDLDESVGTSIAGIDPIKEDKATKLSNLIIEGEYLEKDDFDQVILGALLLKKYLDFESPNFPILENVEVGSRVRLIINGSTREVTVKGIVKSKVDEIDRRVFMNDSQFKQLINRFDNNADEIVIKLKDGVDPVIIRDSLLAEGVGDYATVQTREDAEPKFIKDMKATFSKLGNIISSIGLVVAVITIFIVVFINAITRRKFIGILKGIGVRSVAIQVAYIFQSVFYAIIGTTIGAIFVLGFLEPYFQENPISYPFGDGILAVTLEGVIIRGLILLLATLIAGYIPARMVTKQNTLDAILNR